MGLPFHPTVKAKAVKSGFAPCRQAENLQGFFVDLWV